MILLLAIASQYVQIGVETCEANSWWAKHTPKQKMVHLKAAGLWDDAPEAHNLDHIQRHEDLTLAIYEHCKGKRCEIRASIVDGKQRKKTVSLDPGPDASVLGTCVTDFDGDGKPELTVRQSGRAKRHKNGEKTTYNALHVLSLPELEKELRVEMGWDSSVMYSEGCETVVAQLRGNVEAVLDCKGKVQTWRFDYDTEKDRYVADERRWAVLAGAFKQGQEGAEILADDKADALKAAGFAHALPLDGRTFSKLKCCFDVVVVDRFATKAEAMALLEKVRLKFPDAYVKRAF